MENIWGTLIVYVFLKRYFVDKLILERLPFLFIILGSILLPIQLLAVIFIRNPIASPVEEIVPLISSELSVPLSRILRSPLFYALWFTFLFNEQSIIAVTGLYKAFGLNFWSDDKSLTVIGSLGSISNALGRLFWGCLADRVEYRVRLPIPIFEVRTFF